MIKIIGVGDIMPGGVLSGSSKQCVNNDVLNVLQSGDVRVGTLECALGNEPTYDQEKVADRGNVIYAKDIDVHRLKELNVDVVSLANNHFFDLGPDGAKHTINLLDEQGVMHCGAGMNLEEAGAPAVMEVNNKSIAFLGFCDTDYNNVFWCTYATSTKPGVNPMQKDYVLSEIKKNVAIYDYVVVLAHWGTENTYYPNYSSVRMAKLMLRAGACLVLGSHPHRIQPLINYKKHSVAFSMGNFLFPERLIAPPKVTYYPDGYIDYSTLPVTDEYPIVESVTLKTLPYLARVGMIVISELEKNDIYSKYYLSYLNSDNIVTLLGEEQCHFQKKIIDKIGFFIYHELYHAMRLIKRCMNYINRRLAR